MHILGVCVKMICYKFILFHCFQRSVVEELEKARRDVQKLDTQLITAVNQKVKLSEQLEQWQVCKSCC